MSSFDTTLDRLEQLGDEASRNAAAIQDTVARMHPEQLTALDNYAMRRLVLAQQNQIILLCDSIKGLVEQLRDNNP